MQECVSEFISFITSEGKQPFPHLVGPMFQPKPSHIAQSGWQWHWRHGVVEMFPVMSRSSRATVLSQLGVCYAAKETSG